MVCHLLHHNLTSANNGVIGLEGLRYNGFIKCPRNSVFTPDLSLRNWDVTRIYPVIVHSSGSHWSLIYNTLRARQHGRYFADDISKCISLNENVQISNKISLKFVLKGPINNVAALVHILACYQPGDKPTSETMMLILVTHLCVTLHQLFNISFGSVLWSYNNPC